MAANYLYLNLKRKILQKNDSKSTSIGGGHARLEKSSNKSKSILGNRTSGTRFSNSFSRRLNNVMI